MRLGRWKLIEFYGSGRVELYDLHADVSESLELSIQEPDTVARLLAALRSWRSDLGARMPQPNPERAGR